MSEPSRKPPALPSFSNLIEHLVNPLPAPLVPRLQITAPSSEPTTATTAGSPATSESSSPSPPAHRNPNSALYSFKALPAPIRLANELLTSSSSGEVSDKKPPAFGVLVRSDRASPAGPASRRMKDVDEPEFECDRCGTTSTPEKRYGHLIIV